MTKLTDIARVLQLDVSVISRALSSSPENQRRVNPETRKRILETAKNMNYVPDRSAAFFRKRKAPTILCYLPGYTDRLVGNLVMGISEEASNQNFPVNFFFGKNNTDFESFFESLKDIKHSAIITYPPPKMNPKMRDELEKYHKNGGCILILNACSNGGIRDDRFVGMPQLQINDVYGGKLVAEHFLGRGVNYFFGTDIYGTYLARAKGYEDSLQANGFSSVTFTPEAFEKAVASGKKVGIFAFNDSIASNIMLALCARGYQAGKDYLLAGHDDQFMSARFTPSLSTIHQPTREEGSLAVKKVVQLLSGESVQDEFLNPWLMVRESSGGRCPDLENPQSEEIIY